MGFAVNNYAIFDSIASGGESRGPGQARLAGEVAAAFDTFTIVAFVLHDPSLHAGFHEYLGQVFESIDRKTGSDLLVFALTRPSAEWKQYALRRRSYYRRLEDALSKVGESPNIGPLAVHALATRIGIPASDLPVIILTQDLGDSGFTWVRTQPDDPELGGGICQQLERLGEFASDLAVGRRSHDLEAMRKALDISGFGQVRLSTSLAEACCQALAPTADRNNEWRMNALLDTVRAEVRAIAEKHRDDLPPEAVQQLADLEITIAYAMRGAKGGRDPRGLKIPAGLEPHSVDLLVLAWDVLDLILARDAAGADMTPVVMCVGKALETELNLSVVQWARGLAGVEMPAYFAKTLPRGHERPVIETEPGNRVDLSSRGRNPDATITNLPAVLGQCIGLLRWAKQQRVDASSAVPDPAVLEGMERWIDYLRQRRNQAAHHDRVNLSDGSEALARATDDIAMGLWDELVRIKRTLRGNS